jgi:hypothetical protein
MSGRKILWHDGYASNIKKVMTDQQWASYTKSIIDYATQNSYDVVSISAIGASVNGDASLSPATLGFLPDNQIAYKYINQFIVEAEEAGLSVGLNVRQKDSYAGKPERTDTIPELAQAIAENIVHTKPLIIGIDGEVNDLAEGKQRTPTEYATKWIDALKKYGVSYDSFAILGGNKQKAAWATSLPSFKNVFEYYSVDGVGGAFNQNLAVKYNNNPSGALDYIQSQMVSSSEVQNPKDPITGAYSGINAAFSIGTGNGYNTLGEHSNHDPIGPAVFGTWDSEDFNEFINLFMAAYPAMEDIFVYHSDQLPKAWIPSSEPAAPEAFYSELFAMM